MKNFLFPDRYIKSVYTHNFEEEYKSGKRGLIFDIDNTLVPHDHKATKEYTELIKKLKDLGFKIVIVSNNNEERVRDFTSETNIPYVYMAHKPSKKGYLKACEMMNLERDRVLFFGDQIYTDILGANRAGIESVLVEPLDRSTDIKKIKLKRYLEKPVINCFFKRKGLQLWAFSYKI